MRMTPLFCTALLACAARSTAGENLIRNGSFDEGERAAAHWETANGRSRSAACRTSVCTTPWSHATPSSETSVGSAWIVCV